MNRIAIVLLAVALLVPFSGLARGGGGGHGGGHGGSRGGGHSRSSGGHSHSKGSSHSAKKSPAKAAAKSQSKKSGKTPGDRTNVKAYDKKDGTHVEAHQRTAADGTKLNNWSTQGNVNANTGAIGTKDPYAP